MRERNERLREGRLQTTLAQAIQNYLTVIKLEGKSPATIRWHRKKLGAFLDFLQDGAEEEVLKNSPLMWQGISSNPSWIARRDTPIIRCIMRWRAASRQARSTVSHGH